MSSCRYPRLANVGRDRLDSGVAALSTSLSLTASSTEQAMSSIPSPEASGNRPDFRRRRTNFEFTVSARSRDAYTTRDETFWYSDGNIIVVAQGVAFRVYKGILAEYSEVFRDMFLLPAPIPEPSESSVINAADGCPVVHVTDTAAEFRSLLSALLRGMQ